MNEQNINEQLLNLNIFQFVIMCHYLSFRPIQLSQTPSFRSGWIRMYENQKSHPKWCRSKGSLKSIYRMITKISNYIIYSWIMILLSMKPLHPSKFQLGLNENLKILTAKVHWGRIFLDANHFSPFVFVFLPCIMYTHDKWRLSNNS